MKHSLFAVGLVVVTALLIGLGALTVARFGLGYDGLGQAETMHDFGYLGGGVGLIVAVAYLIVVRVRWRRGFDPQPVNPGVGVQGET